ncbi:MAG: DUF1730 domain-containing protein [Caldilineaceae bacterium]
MTPSPVQLSHLIKQEARRLGFDHCALLPMTTAPHAAFFEQWVAAGRSGEMTYLARNQAKRRDPQLLAEAGQPELRSMVVLAVNHFQFALPPALRDDPSRGVIASYAWGDDYHEIIRPLLYALDGFICSQSGRQSQGKCLVDTGPVLERDWAHQSGLGFIGKNCCLIRPQSGSWLLLATILIPEVVAYDPPPRPTQAEPMSELVLHGLPPREAYGAWHFPTNREFLKSATCGRCTRCLTACPTDAFVGPYHLDPQRCISYWTIEAKGPIPRTLRPHFGNRIFGCDICQEVCPWNYHLTERTPLLDGLLAQAERMAPALLDGFQPATPYWLDATAFSDHFRRSPIKRAKRHGMLRNVCVALGNWAYPMIIEPLTLALHDPAPLVRGHAAWALGEVLRRHLSPHAATMLRTALPQENDDWVREEIGLALG